MNIAIQEMYIQYSDNHDSYELLGRNSQACLLYQILIYQKLK